jgi:hypothetical protein
MTTGRAIASLAIATVLGLGLMVAPAQAVTTRFTSCDQMHKVYKHGIATNTKAANRGLPQRAVPASGASEGVRELL